MNAKIKFQNKPKLYRFFKFFKNLFIVQIIVSVANFSGLKLYKII